MKPAAGNKPAHPFTHGILYEHDPLQLVAEARAQTQQIDQANAGALNIPRGVLEFKIGDNAALANKDLPIVLYCKTGGRAALAAVNLQRMGYAQVRSLTGGFDGWVSGDQKVETEPEMTQFG